MRSARARFAAMATEWQEVEGQLGLMEAYPDTLVLPEQAMTAVCRWTGSLLDQRSFPIRVHPVPSARASHRPTAGPSQSGPYGSDPTSSSVSVPSPTTPRR